MRPNPNTTKSYKQQEADRSVTYSLLYLLKGFISWAHCVLNNQNKNVINSLLY